MLFYIIKIVLLLSDEYANIKKLTLWIMNMLATYK